MPFAAAQKRRAVNLQAADFSDMARIKVNELLTKQPRAHQLAMNDVGNASE
jgi:hypothetical protein